VRAAASGDEREEPVIDLFEVLKQSLEGKATKRAASSAKPAAKRTPAKAVPKRAKKKA
jgi:hypothetical protein